MRERILECLGTFPKKVFIDDIIMKGNNTNERNA